MTDKTPSTFDLMGAFNDYYNPAEAPKSLSIGTDFGKSVPPTQRKEAMNGLNKNPVATQAPVMGPQVPAVLPKPKEQSGFFMKVLETLEKAYNLSAQATSFALLLGDKNNPLYDNGKLGVSKETLGRSWEASRAISPGRALIKTGYGEPVKQLKSILDTLNVGKEGTDKFINKHMLFAANDFNIYDAGQAERAFREQNVGRFTSWGADVIARFTIDPTIIAGKAIKAYRVGGVAVKNVKELKDILSGTEKGMKARRIKANFTSFVQDTDGMTQADLFRVKAIRESSNPGSMAEILADANKITDKAVRHQTKQDIVLFSMGDPEAAVRLMDSNKVLAAKVANLQDEINTAKYLGAGIDKSTGQYTFELTNAGENLSKNIDLAAQYEKQIADNYKMLSIEGSLNPNMVPTVNFLSGVRRAMSNNQTFIDIRGAQGLGAVYSSYPVRLLTGFAYKRPKGWIDFADNQAVQTVDNMLSRVRGISDKRVSWYNSKIAELTKELEVTKDADAVKVIKDKIKSYKSDLESATFTVERKNELFNKYVSALDPVERANVYQEIEQDIFNTISRQFGFSDAEARKAWRTFSDARGKARNLIRDRAYTAAVDPVTGGPVGGKVRPISGADESSLVIPLPLNETQLAKQLPTLDIDSMYYALNKYTRAQRFEQGGKVYQGLAKLSGSTKYGSEIMDGLDSIIKFEVLARLGYPIRNVGEGTLRILQVAGPMAILARAGFGVKNTLGKRFANSSLKDIFDFSNKSKLATYKAELEATRNTVDDVDALERQIAEVNEMIKGTKKVKDKFGLGLNQITVDGKVYTIEDALGATPERAAYIKDKFISNASQIVDSHFGESSRRLRNIYETNGDFTIVRGTDAAWEDAYLRVINRQVRGSKLTKILLQNKPREVVAKEAESFLIRDPEGRKILKNLALGRDVESIVEANLQNIESLFPSWISPKLKEIASKRGLTADDIKKYFGTDPNIRPDVNGAQVSMANGTSAIAHGWANFLDNFYNIMGEIPERELVRNPLFIDLYRRRMEAVVHNIAESYPGKDIPPAYLRKAEMQARQWARGEMRRTLYDTSERVDSAHLLKYIFPFFGAWADVTEKWGRMLLNDPSVFRKLQTTYASPERMGITEERDGITYINIPGSWGKRMGIGERPMAIPKPSLNLIFQGGSWWNPGAGWFVQYPASVLIKAVPDLERNRLVKEVLPYGADGTGWTDFIVQSAAARRAMALFNEDNQIRKSATVLVTMEENHKYDMGERDTPPSAKEIDNKVKKILALEVATRLTLPFATNTRSPYQFYIDEYHRMRQEDPLNAQQNFYEKYGKDYFIFTTNLAKNNTGIAATVAADKRTTQFADLIAKQPEYGWFIVGDANRGEFSPTVYQKQRETPVAPGSPTKMRESQDPRDAIAKTKSNEGWIVYNKAMDKLEAIRIQRQLKSLQSKGAEDLREAKKAFVAALEQSNPYWAQERGTINTGKVKNFLTFAEKVVDDPRLSERQDMKTLKEYIQGREAIMKALANRKSKNIDAAGNEDIKELWSVFTGLLIDKDVTFNTIYTRILENDNLREG